MKKEKFFLKLKNSDNIFKTKKQTNLKEKRKHIKVKIYFQIGPKNFERKQTSLSLSGCDPSTEKDPVKSTLNSDDSHHR